MRELTPSWLVSPGTPFAGDQTGDRLVGSLTFHTYPTPLVMSTKAASHGIEPPERAQVRPMDDVGRPPGITGPRSTVDQPG